MKLLGVLVGMALGLASLDGQAQSPQKVREIDFSFTAPIVSRLLPNDEIVIVRQYGSGESHNRMSVLGRIGPLKDALDSWAHADVLAVVNVNGWEGTLADNGTWVNTVLHAQIVQSIKSKVTVDIREGSASFVTANGTIVLNGKTVKAGAYPEYQRGSRLLIGAETSRACNCLMLGDAYNVGADGKLAPLKRSNGGDFSARGVLIGLPLEQVVGELKKR